MFEGLFQPIHLVLILAIIMIVFGAGKLPEMGGAVGRGIREFRKEVHDATDSDLESGRTSAVTSTATAERPQGSAFCTSCGERMPSSARFCPSCGASVAVATPSAGVIASEVEPDPVRQEPSAV